MTIIPLVQIDINSTSLQDLPIKKKCQEVKDFGPEFQQIVDDLIDSFMSHKIAVGLSAPQIGITINLSAINLDKENNPAQTMIIVNPKILSTSGEKLKGKESCMSVPHYRGEVVRRKKIYISYQDRFGNRKQLRAEGFLARVIAHEIDHLDGVLYIDRVEDSSKLETTDIFEQV